MPLAPSVPTVMVWVVPFGIVITAMTFDAGLGPLLLIVIVAVTVWPAVLLGGKLMAMATSASKFKVVTPVAVLLPGLVSAELLATCTFNVCAAVLPSGTL